jgi:hypothetical protein
MAERPRASGNPLDLSTEPTVPKPRGQIEIIETGNGLTLADRKLFNVLLALSWEGLSDPEVILPPFSSPAADLRRSIGEVDANGNARLRQSFERLMRTLIRFPYLSLDGQVKAASAPLLDFAALPQGSGTAEWSFPKVLRPMLAEPGAWARIHLSICARFASKYGLALYELLSVRANLRNPTWIVAVPDLRSLLGVGDKMPNWAHFSRRVLIPAVKEVNELSPLVVSFEEQRVADRTHRVEAVTFMISRKTAMDLSEVARLADFVLDPLGKAVTTRRDPDTIDLADGRTDRERGSTIPLAAAALVARIPAKKLEEFCAEFPAIDLDRALGEWSTWAADQPMPCRTPSVAFRGFLSRRAAADAVSTTSLRSGVDGLSAGERSALMWLEGQPYAVRAKWEKRARSLGVVLPPAAAARENLSKWVPTIAKLVCEEESLT